MHEYSPAEALRLLMDKIKECNKGLYDDIQEIIDQGEEKEVSNEEYEPENKNKNSKKYSIRVAYSDEQALSVAIDSLTSFLVETKEVMNMVEEDFTKTSIIKIKDENSDQIYKDIIEGKVESEKINIGERKQIEIDLEPETKKEKLGKTLEIQKTDQKDIDEIKDILKELRNLLTFSETEK